MSYKDRIWITESDLDECKFDKWKMKGKDQQIFVPIEAIPFVFYLLDFLLKNYEIPRIEFKSGAKPIKSANRYQPDYYEEGEFFANEQDCKIVLGVYENNFVRVLTLIHELIHYCHWCEKGIEHFELNPEKEQSDTLFKETYVMRAFRRLYKDLKHEYECAKQQRRNHFPIKYGSNIFKKFIIDIYKVREKISCYYYHDMNNI